MSFIGKTWIPVNPTEPKGTEGETNGARSHPVSEGKPSFGTLLGHSQLPCALKRRGLTTTRCSRD